MEGDRPRQPNTICLPRLVVERVRQHGDHGADDWIELPGRDGFPGSRFHTMRKRSWCFGTAIPVALHARSELRAPTRRPTGSGARRAGLESPRAVGSKVASRRGLAVEQVRREGRRIDDDVLAHISPAHSENINFFGAIEVDIDAELAQLGPTGYRPLRARNTLF